MIEWMKIKDLSEYLQIPESRIRSLINHNGIPFHNSHGFLRFNREEIDDWMKTPLPKEKMTSDTLEAEKEGDEEKYIYRGRPIKDYMLTATKILTVEPAWLRLPDFIKKSITEIEKRRRDYLYREEFKPFLPNFDDYLRVSCQLGLVQNVGKEEKDERIKRYYASNYAKFISTESYIWNIKRIILESILYIVETRQETRPDEKHAILLLWFILKIKISGAEPRELHFKKITDKPNNYFPNIRLMFAKSLCLFLFDGDTEKERNFLSKWEQIM
ncbi:MAG TPA: helix-turn-helix domain-containing protein [Dissulfurispiraceae bacterium]|nr:helix-turn-helix domain-containing protein [Dissulfurispiraceae bacterium]